MSAQPHRAEPPLAARAAPARRATRMAVALAAVAVLMRLNNAVRFPSLHGYDSFGHVTYIWYLIKAGRVPLPTSGWSFFHPPLYYALAAAVWLPLRSIDPKQVLKIINLIFGIVGLVPAWIAYRIARDAFPRDRSAQLAAPLYVLFLPVCLYTAPMLGNEHLNAVLCSAALYALIRTLQRGTYAAAAALGVALGLALLTKTTAIALLAAAVAALLAWTVHSRRWRRGGALLGLALSLTLLIAGWYYARNVQRYGTPFVMSRTALTVAHVEDAFPRGDRGWLGYLWLDPRIFVFPRYVRGPVLNSVWAGVFGGTWFDVVGTATFTPTPEDSAPVAAVGSALIILGIVPTALCVLGAAAMLWRLWRRRWDAVVVAMLAAFGAVLGSFVLFTRQVPVFSAVKASYLLPAIVPFAFWFAAGVHALRQWRRTLRAALAVCALLLGLIIPVFTYQLVFEAELTGFYWNALGVTYALAGYPQRAEELFATVARAYHLYFAHENVAAMALDSGRPQAALDELAIARQLAAEEIFAVGADRERLRNRTWGEYDTTAAAAAAALGDDARALAAARAAIATAPDIAEAHYNLAALLWRHGERDAAAAEVASALHLDPQFSEAGVLAGIIAAARGDCGAAAAAFADAARTRQPRRTYPWQTGRGDLLDAGLARRRVVPLCSGGDLDPYAAARACAMHAPAIPWLHCRESVAGG